MRTRITLATLAVAGTAAVALASAAQGSDGPNFRPWGLQPGSTVTPKVLPGLHQARALRFTLSNVQQTSVDNDPSGGSQGDEVNVTGTLNADGRRVGVLDVHGVLTAAGSSSQRIQYTFTATLPHGQITAIGVARIGQNTTGFRGGVAGGTLRYRDARGQVTVSFAQNGGANFLYELMP